MGDGIPRALSSGGEVLINGKRYPIVGTICMDNFMIDLGNNPDHLAAGHGVTIIGSDGGESITVSDIGVVSGVNPRELSIHIGSSRRVGRHV